MFWKKTQKTKSIELHTNKVVVLDDNGKHEILKTGTLVYLSTDNLSEQIEKIIKDSVGNRIIRNIYESEVYSEDIHFFRKLTKLPNANFVTTFTASIYDNNQFERLVRVILIESGFIPD